MQKRPSAARWIYLPAALVMIFFGLLGWGEEGVQAAGLYIVLLLVCLIQALYPTRLVWAVLFSLFSAYTVAVAMRPDSTAPGEYVFFLMCGTLPAIALLCGWPKSDETQAGNRLRSNEGVGASS